MVIIYAPEKAHMVNNLEVSTARIDSESDCEVPPSTVPPQIEDLILWAFGKSIIEFEATLFHKFHLLSGDIVLSKKEFRWHLENMKARGLVFSSEFEGVRSWSRYQ